MLTELREALRQAVANFRAEMKLSEEEEGLLRRIHALDEERSSEREALETCLRRGALALKVGDHATAEVAEAFALRHRTRIELLDERLVALRMDWARARESEVPG